MSRIIPVRWQILECIFKKAGFSFERQSGDHKVYSKRGVHRPIIIPLYKEVSLDIIKANMKTANMTREEYFKFLKKCK